jgi:hypothetical protein
VTAFYLKPKQPHNGIFMIEAINQFITHWKVGNVKVTPRTSTFSIAGILLVATVSLFSQSPTGTPGQVKARGRGPMIGGPGSPTADGSRAVHDGGIKVLGWLGMVDATEDRAGMSIKDTVLAQDGYGLRATTGPAVTYWRPDDIAKGDYTVSASFTEPKYMNLNTRPHPYGVFIAGNDMGTPKQSDLYCAAYGNGTFIVRGFGPVPFQMNGEKGEVNRAVHKAERRGRPVSQDITLSVKGNQVECSINGTVVATYNKSALVTQGKLKSTDGIYGLRFAHNAEVKITAFETHIYLNDDNRF